MWKKIDFTRSLASLDYFLFFLWKHIGSTVRRWQHDNDAHILLYAVNYNYYDGSISTKVIIPSHYCVHTIINY